MANTVQSLEASAVNRVERERGIGNLFYHEETEGGEEKGDWIPAFAGNDGGDCATRMI